MGWLAAQGAIMAIGLFIGLVCSVIGLFFGHIILFDSIALGIAAGVCCNQFTAIHPALCLVIGIATFLLLLWLQNTSIGFWLVGGLLTLIYAAVFGLLAYFISEHDPHDRLRAFDWAGLAALALFTYKVPGSRGAFGGMAVLFVLFFVQKFLPRLFDSKIFYGLALALPVALAVFSLYAGYVYNPEWPYERMALLLLSIALSGRFEIWHNVFWSAPLSLLGGLPTDGDEHHAIDNTFLAVPMNKGLLGAILVAAVFLLLLWRLAKKHRSTEVICLVALTLYLFMENKPFLLSANPFLLMLPVVFFNAETGKAQSES